MFQKLIIDDNTQIGIVLSGLPACGKSTLVEELTTQFHFYVISKDIIRLELARLKYGKKSRRDLMNVLETFSAVTKFATSVLIEMYRKLVLKNADKKEVEQYIINNAMLNISNNPKFEWCKNELLSFFLNEANKLAFNDYHNGIIFDSTHLYKKAREIYTKALNIPMYSIFIDIPLEESIKRNHVRRDNGEYYVPDDVIWSMNKSIMLPHKSEGFQYCFVEVYTDDNKPNKSRALNIINDLTLDNICMCFPSFMPCINYNQHNKHHTLLLHEHQLNVANAFKNNYELFIMSLLHDVGKPKCAIKTIIFNKEFDRFHIGQKLILHHEDDKYYYAYKDFAYCIFNVPKDCADIDKNIHYYDHQNVSAIMVLRDLLSLGFDYDYAMNIYWMIFYHMAIDEDMKFKSDKTYKELCDRLDEKYINMLMEFKKADYNKKS